MSGLVALRHEPRTYRGGALDALRFLAAIFVLLFHFGQDAPTPLERLHGFMGRGYLATDFFLLLSGFVLVRAYGASILAGRISYGRFMTKRFVRMYPTHIVTLGLLIAMVLTTAALGLRLKHPEHFAWSAVPAQVLLLNAWGWGGDSWNVPSWTISALLACYAAFPALWRWMQAVSTPVRCLLIALAVTVASDLFCRIVLHQEQFDIAFPYSMLRAAPLFVVGVVLARLVETARLGANAARALSLGATAALAVNAALNGPNAFSILAIMTLIVGIGAAPQGRRWPGAAWGAKLSFTLFMTHTLAGAAWFDGVRPALSHLLHPGALGAWLIWGGALAFALLCAAAFHHFIDQPIQKAAEAWMARSDMAAPQPGPPERGAQTKPEPRKDAMSRACHKSLARAQQSGPRADHGK